MKLLYDMDECTNTPTCPKFVVDEKTQIVSLIDRQGNKANMSIEHFNKFVRAVKKERLKNYDIEEKVKAFDIIKTCSCCR